MFTCDRKKRKLVEEKKLLLVNQRCCSSGCYSGWIVISSRSHVEKGTAVSGANADEQQLMIRSRCRAHARSFPKLKLGRGGKINFSRFISPNPSAFVCFRGNRLAAHTLAVIERCECACGSAANATTLAKLSLPLASLAKLARCIARIYNNNGTKRRKLIVKLYLAS
ncbi:hypothetical protein T01_9228 [Trichinella spiralis]|uniref:Uncharacterized protein n=1 Tax=Trichinella spiralis TaxID=6334 RepID=A0A0V1C3C1_TRISP|nr:hypothetical protein T01_9228 [Trichinella spiralis]